MNGNDTTGTGTEAQPFATVQAAVSSIFGATDFRTIYCKAGTYTMFAFGGGYMGLQGWLNITRAPVVARGNVLFIGRGTGNTHVGLVEIGEVTVRQQSGDGVLFSSESQTQPVNVSVAGTHVYGSGSITATARLVEGTAMKQYCLGTDAHPVLGVAGERVLCGFRYIEDADIDDTAGDIFTNGVHFRDVRVINAASHGASHTDGYQGFGAEAAAGNVLGMDCTIRNGAQILLINLGVPSSASRHAFINCEFHCSDGNSQLSGGDGVIIWHCTIDQILWLAVDPQNVNGATWGLEHATAYSVYGCIISNCTIVPVSGSMTEAALIAANGSELAFAYNHYSNPASVAFGSNTTTGAITYVNAATGNFTVLTPTAVTTPDVPRVVPWDINQTSRQLTTARGPRAATIEAPTSPVISIAGYRIISPGRSVTISAAEGVIYYTTTGVDPTDASTPYTVPITISANSVLKARCYVNGFPSLVAQTTFDVITNGTPAPPRRTP